VVVAASAGGLGAIASVLSTLQADLAAAVVVVQHLDPHHRSLVAEILARRTRLPVEEARDGERLRSGRVCVAPPDHHVLVNSDGTLSLSRSALVRFLRPSADLLFESAAAAYGPHAIAVVLTGTGRDGAAGAEAVKRMGGMVIAQDAATSAFFGMPGAAISTGAVDLVLPLERIGPAVTAAVAGSVGAD